MFAVSLDAGIIIIKIVSPKFHHIGPLLAFIRTISVPNTWEPDMLFFVIIMVSEYADDYIIATLSKPWDDLDDDDIPSLSMRSTNG